MHLLYYVGILTAQADSGDQTHGGFHITLNRIDDTASERTVPMHALSARGFSLLERFHAHKKPHRRWHLRNVIQPESLRDANLPEHIAFDLPVSNFMNHEYMGTIEVGTSQNAQRMNVVFDTGSTNIWINSVLCDSETCQRRVRFDPSKSSTFFSDEEEVEKHFGTAALHGVKAQETFRIGPFAIRDQGFALVTKETGKVFDAIPIEGIVGMSFRPLSAFAPEGVTDRIMETHQLDQNKFSFYLAKRGDGDSVVMFGEPDHAFYKDPMHCFPVLKEEAERKYWLVAVESLHLTFPEAKGKTPIKFDGPSMVLFDSGTNLYSVDPEYFPKLVAHFLQCKLGEYEETYPEMPHLRFEMKTTQGETIFIDIPPNEYMSVGADVSDNSPVKPGWMAVECEEPDGPSYIFGQMFMHYWLTVFDRSTARPQVCIARALHSQKTQQLLKDEGTAEENDMPLRTMEALREYKAPYALPEVGFSSGELHPDKILEK